jgi:hypothetical protein
MRRFHQLVFVMFLTAPLAAQQSQTPPPAGQQPQPPVPAVSVPAQTPPPTQRQPPPPAPPVAVAPAPGSLPTVTIAPTPGRGAGQGRGGRGSAPATAVRQTTPPPGGRAGSIPVRPIAMPEPAIMQNVRLELTITDSLGAGSATKKTVTMIVANEHNGRIRSSNDVRQQVSEGSWQFKPITINVDASPRIRADGRVQLGITLEYVPELPAAASASASPRPATVNESLTVLLADGKPMLISQSADPSTDRRVTVEVTATVLK